MQAQLGEQETFCVDVLGEESGGEVNLLKREHERSLA